MGALYSSLQATVYEDAEDGLNTRWTASNGGVVTNITDVQKGSKVISLQGGAYVIGDLKQGLRSWNNRNEKNLKMSMKFGNYFYIYVSVLTSQGVRTLIYTPRDGSIGDRGNGYFEFGVGKDAAKGTWVDIIRNLDEDLKTIEADNSIIAIDGLKILGSGLVDDLELKDKARHPEKMYEDAEDGDTFGWQVYDKSPLGATITNVFDAEKNSKVISLNGGGMENGYIVGNWNGRPNAWAELDRKTLTWEMKFTEAYGFFVTVETTKGHRYLYYDATNQNRGIIGNGEYIHHGLTPGYMDGKWHTVSVDLEGDLKEYEPDNSIVRITGFLIRGTGLIDDIRFTDGPPILPPTLYEDAEDGISEGWTTVVGGTPVKREVNHINGVAHTYVRLKEHWHKNDDGTWTNPAEYHLEMHNRTQKILSFDVGGSGYNVPHYVTGARVTTRQGVRSLLWSSFYKHENIPATNRNGFMIFPSPVEQVRGWFGIDVDKWENFTVNLEESLQIFEPDNSIISVDYFVSTGGVLDNIQLK